MKVTIELIFEVDERSWGAYRNLEPDQVLNDFRTYLRARYLTNLNAIIANAVPAVTEAGGRISFGASTAEGTTPLDD
jgi:hypothetical protein